MTSNPLLEIRYRVPFDEIRAEHVRPAIEELLTDARAQQKALAESTGPRTFENTLLALEDMTERLAYAMSVVGHLEGVATYPELRDAYNDVQGPVSEYYTNIMLDPGLWRILKQYAATGEARSLNRVRARFLKKEMDAFRRNGAELDDEGKRRLAAIDVELTQLTTRFSQNVLDSTNAFELVITDERRLAGLPPSAIDAARDSARSKNVDGWRFTLQGPSYLAVMTYLDDAAIREQMYLANSVRAASGDLNNVPLISRIVELRQEKAELLGFRNFADLVLEDRMAHDGARARAFLEDLKQRTEAAFERENAELAEFRRKLEGPGAPPLQPWDVSYYAEKMRAALYQFDEEELRPYFPLEQVLSGMFDVVERLYGITVEEQTGVPVWDPEVKFYTVRDSGGEHLGSFYADWFPRENKRPGAWMDAFITGRPTANGFEPHLGLMCGNMTRPTGGRPALLTHREIETVFHEFGHLLHHTLSRVEIRSIAGTNVAWDFVELPSQIMENWCWEREALDLVARHYESGEPLPPELFEKMRRARCFRAANMQMRQLGFGFIDLLLHVDYSPSRHGDLIRYSRELLQQFSPAPLPPEHAMIASFNHLFSSPVGYAAGYYSYKWAEVLDADAFTRFSTCGVFNREAGLEFREKILARGDSEDPAELYRSFMGRDPDPSALLRRSGLM